MMFDAAGNLIETDDGGIYKRTSPRDATGNWFSLNGTLQVTEEHDLSYDTFADIAFTGTQDNDDPHQATPGQAVWFVLLSGDGGDTAVDNSDRGAGLLDSATTAPRACRPSCAPSGPQPTMLDHFVFPARTLVGGGPAFVGQFTTPVEVNAITPTGSSSGERTAFSRHFDQGDTIRRISTVVINGNGVDAVSYGGVGNADLAGRRGESRGAADRLFMRTAAHPAPLNEVLTYPRTAGRTVRDIVIHPANANAIYLTNTTQVFQTLDGGATWNNLSGNIQSFAADRAAGHRLRRKGRSNDLLFVSTFNGIYVAREATGFTTWEPLGTGLPKVPILDLLLRRRGEAAGSRHARPRHLDAQDRRRSLIHPLCT